jgi:hypothetical protein
MRAAYSLTLWKRDNFLDGRDLGAGGERSVGLLYLLRFERVDKLGSVQHPADMSDLLRFQEVWIGAPFVRLNLLCGVPAVYPGSAFKRTAIREINKLHTIKRPGGVESLSPAI